MSQSRQLAAIMFTDIVGYTALMGKDEEKAFDILKKNRQIQRPLIDHHNGKLLKEMGDGMLASFHTVSDAVYCALEIQKKSKEDAGFQLRIGIHLGEVVFEKNDVFGDGVNIASRMQAIAPEGQVVVSESVYRNIANKKGLIVEFWREEMLKNVDTVIKIYTVRLDSSTEQSADQFLHRPTHSPKTGTGKKKAAGIILVVLALIAAGVFIYPRIFSGKPSVDTTSTTSEKKSIAVLPFTDMSAEKNQEYLGDGIAEEILNVLNTTMKDLKVTGRTSSFALKDSSLKAIGRILNVNSVLEGSVQKAEKQVKVIVRLLNVDDGSIIWTEPFDREVKNLFSLQNEIAAIVGEKLKLTFENKMPVDSVILNPQAYDLVLKGNYYFNKGPQGFREAVEYYKKAIVTDSGYAYSYIKLGWAIYQMTLSGQYPTNTGFAMARSEIEKALKLKLTASDKQSSHHLLAFINLWEYNWKAARAEYEKTFAINQKPDDFDAWYYSLVLGKTVEAVSRFEKISNDNPVDFLKLRQLAILQYLARQFEEAMQTCDKILELDPSFSEAFRIKGNIFSAKKEPDSALVYFNKAAAFGNDWGKLLTLIELPRVMKKDQAKKVFLTADSLNPAAIPAIARALIYHSFGETDKAFEWLNKSYRQKDFWLASLRVDPLWDPMRKEPAFQKLMKKMNFPE